MKRRQRGTDMRGLFVFEGSGRLFCNYNQCGFAKQTRHTSGVVQFVAERVIIHPSAELSRPHVCHYHLLTLFFKQCVPRSNLCLSPSRSSLIHTRLPGTWAQKTVKASPEAAGGMRAHFPSVLARNLSLCLSPNSKKKKKKKLNYFFFKFIF